MGFENFKFVDFVIVKKPIRGLEPVRRLAGFILENHPDV
jgi:hypothetical protein